MASLRAAAGPADLRGDLRAFPSILLRSKAGLIPGLVIVVTAGALFIPALAANPLVAMAGNIILQPPPMIIAFLAGMLAPRAAWLMGGLMSVLAGLAYVLVVTVNTDVLITPLGFTYVVSVRPEARLCAERPDQRARLRDRRGRVRRLLPPLPEHVGAPAPGKRRRR